MSPALFKKYYAAAEFVADHALLTPVGPAVRPASRRHLRRSAEVLRAGIIHFYEQHAVDYDKYLTALWLYQHRPAARKKVTIEAWAKEKGLSPKYLHRSGRTLQGETTDEFLVHWLRSRWNALPRAEESGEAGGRRRFRDRYAALAADIQRLSRDCARAKRPPSSPTPATARSTTSPAAAARPIRATPSTRAVLGNRRVSARIQERHRQADPQTRRSGRRRGRDQGRRLRRPQWQLHHDAADDRQQEEMVAARGARRARPRSAEETRLRRASGGRSRRCGQPGREGSGTAGNRHPDEGFPLKTQGERHVLGRVPARRLDRTASRWFACSTASRRKETCRTSPRCCSIRSMPVAAPVRSVRARRSAGCFPNRFYLRRQRRAACRPASTSSKASSATISRSCQLVLTDAENQQLDRLWDGALLRHRHLGENAARVRLFRAAASETSSSTPISTPSRRRIPSWSRMRPLVNFKAALSQAVRTCKATGDALAKHPINIFFEEIRNGLKDRAETLKRGRADLSERPGGLRRAGPTADR